MRSLNTMTAISKKRALLLGSSSICNQLKQLHDEEVDSEDFDFQLAQRSEDFVDQATTLDADSVPEHEFDLVWFAMDIATDALLHQIKSDLRDARCHRFCQAVVIISLAPLDETDEARKVEDSLIEYLSQYANSVTILRITKLFDRWFLNTQKSLWSRFALECTSDTIPTHFVTVSCLYSSIRGCLTKPTSASSRRFTLTGRFLPRYQWFQLQKNPGARKSLPYPLRKLAAFLKYLSQTRLTRWMQDLKRMHGSGQTTVVSPKSIRELLEWYNPVNYSNIQVAGYNHGITHFGWQFPGKTILKTSRSGKLIRLVGEQVTIDAGLTLRAAIDHLKSEHREFCVVPNFSYICMGTLFYVPVHGSGCDISTLSETIESALLYDPIDDRILKVRRGTEAFNQYVYNRTRPSLCLRLRLRTRPASRYFKCDTRLESPSAEQLLRVFSESLAQNVEMRKHRALDKTVVVSEYFSKATLDYVQEQSDATRGSSKTLEVAQDRIGRIWDWLEETPLLRECFHWFVRCRAFHTELFLDDEEFKIFWSAHERLPLKKIQLRKINRDDLPHSPIGTKDRISVDLFMLKEHRAALFDFVHQYLPLARNNPGKQSL